MSKLQDGCTDRADCLELVDINAFTAYSTLRTCATSFRHMIGRNRLDNTIYKLSSSSGAVAREMEESYKLQKNIAEGQQSSLEYQRQLVLNGSHLSKVIETRFISIQPQDQKVYIRSLCLCQTIS